MRLSHRLAPIASLLLVLGSSQVAQAGSSNTTDSETSVAPLNSANSETATTTATSASTPINQQTGVIQFNNSGLSALTYPNCGGACIFAIGRMAPTGNGNASWEAVAGLVWQFQSPENTQAQANKMIAQAQSDNLTQESTVALAEKLAEAIESGKRERATLLAIILAKKLGYPSHLQLLQGIQSK
jgi:hypothetical protein